jgi:hypothetical protein
VAPVTVARKGRLSTRLSCREAACAGDIELIGRVATPRTVTKTKRTATVPKGRSHLAVLAKGTFSLPTGAVRPVSLRLTATGELWLAEQRSHRALAEIKLTLRGGASATRTVVVY